MEILKKRLKDISFGKVLDVGTRSGEFINKLKECTNDYSEMIGIDNNESTVKAANEKCNCENIRFMTMDAANMEFEDDSFDTVCISNTLHHLPDIKIILEEMKRVLKPNGLFIINEMFNDNQAEPQLTHVYLHHLEADIDTLIGKSHNKTLKKEEIINIVKELKINIEDTIEYFETEEMDKKLKSKIESFDKKLEPVKDFPEYKDFKKRIEEIRDIYNDVGIKRCTQLLVIGRI